MRSCEWQPEVAAGAVMPVHLPSRRDAEGQRHGVTPWSGLALTDDINFLPYELPAPMPVHDLFLPHRRPHSHAVLEDMMTECHLSKCNPSSLIRQIAIGLAAGALCLLILSYVSPTARQDEPEVGEAAPDQVSGAAATLIPPAETGFLPSAPESIERQVDGVAGKLTPMLDVPASGALPIVAEDVVLPEPPIPAPSAPLVAIEPAAIPEPVSTPAPEPVRKPAAKSLSKPATVPEPQGKASGKVNLTPASVLHQKNINHLSIQLMGASSLDAVAQFVRVNRLADQVWIYRTNYHGSPWYVVLKGDYVGLSQAQAAIRQLSPALQKADPWPKSFAQVNRELKP